MSSNLQQYALRVIAGQATGPRAAVLRSALSMAEMPYRLAASIRNRRFDTGSRKSARLPRPVISIGNITTGGTGKTPVVRWLAERLRENGERVAVLSRGYKAKAGEHGDEQRMLSSMLNGSTKPLVFFESSPSRVRAGNLALDAQPQISVFLLDDGFQHRQLARDFDLVLINAAEPFGYGRMLPRGLLREPLAGLSRASAFLLTRCDRVTREGLSEIKTGLRKHNSTAPIYESDHVLTNADQPTGKRALAFCGLGDPESFFETLTANGYQLLGKSTVRDHHVYTDSYLKFIKDQAQMAGAEVLVTTEKDWVKVRELPSAHQSDIPIVRVDVEIRFRGEDEAKLSAQIHEVIAARRQGETVGSV